MITSGAVLCHKEEMMICDWNNFFRQVFSTKQTQNSSKENESSGFETVADVLMNFSFFPFCAFLACRPDCCSHKQIFFQVN